MLALITARSAERYDTDLPLLRAALPDAAVVAWDDDDVDWSTFDAAVLRSPWDYHRRLDQFLAWARRVALVTSLWNPLELVEWNLDKHYLADLERQGLPVVHTDYVPPGQSVPEHLDLGRDLVVKPTIGAGANGVLRSRGDAAAVHAHLAALHAAGRTAMVQRYVADIEVLGETGLVYLGGEYSHAFEKAALLAAPVEREGGLYAKETISARTPSSAERDVAERVMDCLPPTAYARIDLLPAPDGPVVLEVEVTEPSLFLHVDRDAPERAAAAFRGLGRRRADASAVVSRHVSGDVSGDVSQRLRP